MDSIQEICRRGAELARAREAEALEQAEKEKEARAEKGGDKKEADVIQFPLWPEPKRAVPNAFLRSALFGVVKKGARRYCKKEKLAAWSDTELAYTGEQLNQYDEDVWMQLVHLHRLQGIAPGKPLYVNAKQRGFMREFGRGHGKNTAKFFYESVHRMEACGVHLMQRIEGKEVEYTGNLVQKFAQVRGEERWLIVLNPDLLPYFAPGHHTHVDWETRRSLRTDLAKWLHGYVCSHQTKSKQPHRITVERLRELSGSVSELKRFRFNVKKAMTELKAKGTASWWRINENDVLEFVRV